MQEVKLIKDGDTSCIDLVVNMEGMVPSKEVPKKDIADALDVKPTATIPFDAKLFIGSENEGKKLTGQKGGDDIINTLLPVTRNILKQADNVDVSEERPKRIA